MQQMQDAQARKDTAIPQAWIKTVTRSLQTPQVATSCSRTVAQR